ncbi:hypothetical protein PFISCL1PPCAC_5405, partial [Pristionchus fissidentatus]
FKSLMVRIKGAGYYAVARGKQIGVYHSWADCEKQVRGFPNAKFKKFITEPEANMYIETHRSRERDGGYAYSVNPASSLSSPYSRQQQNVQPDPHDLTGLDNMAATALMSLFGRPSTSSSASSSPFYAAPFANVQQQQQRQMSTSSGVMAAASTSNGNGSIPTTTTMAPAPTATTVTRKRSHTKMMRNGGEEEFSASKKARVWSSISFADASIVYTDGACSKNGRHNSKAGWGVWWGDGHADNDCGPVPGDQTNNRAELLAVIKAINRARMRGLSKLIVRTDSMLLINSMDKWIVKWKSNGWKTADGKDVKNQDMLMILDAQLEVFPVHFEHVPGHAGVHGNEMADQLARHAAAEVAAGRLFIPDILLA